MPPREPLNLEELLEHLGSSEIPGDSQHRYVLRRALLRSRCFETNQHTARLLRLFSLTTSAMAGGAVAVVLVLAMQATLEIAEENKTNHLFSSVNSLQSRTSQLPPIQALNQVRLVEINEIMPAQGWTLFFDEEKELAIAK